MINLANLLGWLISLPFAASPLIYLAGRISFRIGINKTTRATRISGGLTLLSFVLMWIPFILLGPSIIAGRNVEFMIGAIVLRMDGISYLLTLTALCLGMLVTIYSLSYLANETGAEKYFALLTALVGSIIGLGCAQDLFNLWVWFEAMAFSSYFLVSFYMSQRGSLEAGFKYLTQSTVGSVLVLMAIALVFAITGSIRLDEISAWKGPFSLVLLAAGAQFLIGFGVKAAIVPMHTWLPDAHSQAPSGISAMLSGIVIEAGLIAMLRSLGSLPFGSQIWGALLIGFGAVNMLVGNLMALRQTQVKRLLAYSSLSHLGYMLLGFGAASMFHNTLAAAGGFFHLLTHALMKGLAFLAAGSILYGIHLSRDNHSSLVLDDLNGAGQKYPLEVFGLSLAVLALGGLPPLAGFMSKWQIFVGSIAPQNIPMVFVVLFAALNSVLSLGYYAPLVNRMYRKEASQTVKSGNATSFTMKLPVIVLVFLIAAIGFWPSIVQGVTGPAATIFLEMFGSSSLLMLH